MTPLAAARIVILVLVIAFVTSLLYFAMTPDREDKPCPKDKPVRVEDFSCVSKDFHEGTFVQRSEAGQK